MTWVLWKYIHPEGIYKLTCTSYVLCKSNYVRFKGANVLFSFTFYPLSHLTKIKFFKHFKQITYLDSKSFLFFFWLVSILHLFTKLTNWNSTNKIFYFIFFTRLLLQFVTTGSIASIKITRVNFLVFQWLTHELSWN